MNLNPNISIILRFTIILAILLSMLSFIIDFGVKNSYSDQIGKVNLILKHQIDPEIIAFGSSVGEVGLNPNILTQATGLNSFNCSIDGTSYIQYKGLLDEFNSNSPSNKYVIFLESYFSFQKPAGVSAAERYLAHINNDNLFSSLNYLQPELIWKCKYIPFYKYVAVTHVYYKNSIKGLKNYINRINFNDSLNGYTPVYREWELDQDSFLRNIKPFTIEINQNVVKKYIETITAFKKNKKSVIIVLPPIYTQLSNKLTDFKPLRETLTQISESTGVQFIDFTISDICNHKEYFYNSNHLNYSGSKNFSQQLSDSLNEYIKSTYK